jgi:hypothetical protein
MEISSVVAVPWSGRPETVVFELAIVDELLLQVCSVIGFNDRREIVQDVSLYTSEYMYNNPVEITPLESGRSRRVARRVILGGASESEHEGPSEQPAGKSTAR